MISKQICLATLLLASAACGPTEIKGANSTQPAPQTQTPAKDSKGTDTSAKESKKPTEAKNDSEPKDTTPTLGSVGSADSRPDNDQDGAATADSRTGEQASVPAAATSSQQSSDPNVVVFRIKAGTGNGPWNDESTAIQARVGQTLEVHNDDSVQHWIHADFGQFMTHPFSGIDPGQSARYTIGNDNARGLHDHRTNGAIHMKISQ